MNERVYQVLEFQTIVDRLRELTTCEPSAEMARRLEPSKDPAEIEVLLQESEDAVSLITAKGQPPLAGVKDIRPAVRRARAGGDLSYGELLSVAGLLRAVRRILNYSSAVDLDTENRMVCRIGELLEDRRLEERISHCILSEEEMSDDASPALRQIRRQIRDKQESIKDNLNQLIHSSQHAKAIQDAVVTMRGDRYCIPVKVEYRSEIPGLVHDTSSTGQTLFVEPAFVVEANNKIRELRGEEKREMQRIVEELSADVCEKAELLLSDLEGISYVDFTFAKARLALDMKALKPQINDQGRIRVIKGRHPLIPKQKVVPISFHIGEAFSTLVITGPNTGGKTVAIKTVGLFTLMMQSGLLIPASPGTELSVYEGVFADIGDEQSISQSLSTFSSHMTNIVEMLRQCNHRSLVLFDELGAGTDPTEGAALAMAILECVHQMGATTVATTHYSELKVFAATTEGFANASCEFDVQTLQPTYKLLIGIPGKSNAFAISQRIGLDPQIVARAKEFLSQEDLRFEDMLLGIEESRSVMETERQEAIRLRQESEALRQEIKEEQETLQARRSEMIAKAREEARGVLQKAKQEADRLLAELRKAAQSGGSALRSAEQAKQELSALQNQVEGELYEKLSRKPEETTPPPKTLKPGDNVRILSLGGQGTVLKAPDKDGQVFLQAGILKVYLPLSDLRLEQASQPGKKALDKGSRVTMKSVSIRTEVDLRGCTVEEAVLTLEKYLDDAILAHLSQFSVIHGKGTGALRAGIHKYLKSERRIKGFRLGEYGEGDAGVTIVQIR